MSEPSFASLGPTLLARKGGAKPAMRPQLAPLVADEAEGARRTEDMAAMVKNWRELGPGAQFMHETMGQYFRFDSTDGQQAMVAMMVPKNDSTWFFKFMGDRDAVNAQTAAFRPLDENDADQCDDDHEVNYEQYGLHGMSILPNRGKINEVGGSLHERNGQ